MLTNSGKSVKILTLLALFSVCGCSVIYDRYGEVCNSRAYTHQPLRDHITSRFNKNAPVRMAIIPFSTQANLSSVNTELPGLGNELAWKVHSRLLETGEVPIVEVFNRQDWPAKKEEFFTGNFGALAIAREAGYDMLMVGYVEDTKSLDSLSVYSKIMDVDSGVTIWYGKNTATTRRRRLDNLADTFWLDNKVPSIMYTEAIINKVAQCLVNDVTSDEVNSQG